MRNKRFKWTKEEKWLKDICSANGWSYEEREPDYPTYQLAKIDGPDFCIIAYPHTTKSTGNQHVRLRNQGSINAELYKSAVIAIYNSKMYPDCTFQTKHFDINAAISEKTKASPNKDVPNGN